MKSANYEKLLTNNITTQYNKAEESTINAINRETQTIATGLKLDDRIEEMAEKKDFITLKDHKENFFNSPKCRLINPAKSEIGKISKVILQRINNNIRSKTDFQQWRSSNRLIAWFNDIRDKQS